MGYYVRSDCRGAWPPNGGEGYGSGVIGRMNVPRRLLWILAALSLLHACGGDASTVVITAEEFRFSPARVEWTFDRSLHLIIRNQGRERHVFQSPGLFGAEGHVIWHQPKVTPQEAHSIVLDPGKSIELHFTLSPGLYPFRCWVKGHTGMEGVIMVKGSPSEQGISYASGRSQRTGDRK